MLTLIIHLKASNAHVLQPLSEEDEDGSVDADENAELIAKGKMKTSVFLKYFQSGASFFTLILLVLILFVGQMASSGADFWVTYWWIMHTDVYSLKWDSECKHRSACDHHMISCYVGSVGTLTIGLCDPYVLNYRIIHVPLLMICGPMTVNESNYFKTVNS